MVQDILPVLLIFLKAGLWIFGLVFFLNGLSDLFIDLVRIGNEVWRRVFVFGFRRAKPLAEEDLTGRPEQFIAVMIPCWDESAVISRMLENSIKVLNYSNYVIFVGTYPNDPATQREVDLVRERYGNVERIVCPKDGPTSKADCLNWIFEGIRHYEKSHGTEFEIIVMEDSEDVLHPMLLKLFNYLIPRMDMVQVPVLPMEPKWWQFTMGTYLDEFATNHSRDMVVRELLTGNLPSAGVGTAFSRKLLLTLAQENQNRLFTIGSVTEDYDFGIRLAQVTGVRQIFSRVAFERTVRKKSRLTGRERTVRKRDYIGVREYFPRTFGTAVRQKSRWILGITLQAWETIGWVGGFWTRYMLARDRVGLITNQVNMLANILVPVYLTVWGYVYVFPDAYRYPPVVTAGTTLFYLMLANLGLLLWQLGIRGWYVARTNGIGQAALSPFRLIWANVINFFATIRAIRLYTRHLLTGTPVAWDKTDHSYPSEEELVRYRRRLGDLLLDRRFVTVAQLDTALDRQRATGQPLGAILEDMGVLEEDKLLQTLGVQLGVQTTVVDPYAVDKEVIAMVPAGMARRQRLFPVGLTPEGGLILAVDSISDTNEIRQLESELGRPIVLRLTTRGDLSFAIRFGYERLARESLEEKLAAELLTQKLITPEQLDEARTRQRKGYRNLGEVFTALGHLDRSSLVELKSCVENRRDIAPMGTCLLEQGVITQAQLDEALQLQNRNTRRLETILIDMDVIDQATLESVSTRISGPDA
ncbi:glycosyl transferase family protein [Desulfonatronum thiodismutans]|uniref:glycosyl transferase family protein n=1 Tax=Desulfonatronum thiodismutans TaxID=159290 RepID=UPI0004ABDAA2|nr:glycosyl transferase family protein [Desulfonatronum thiodismutans]